MVGLTWCEFMRVVGWVVVRMCGVLRWDHDPKVDAVELVDLIAWWW